MKITEVSGKCGRSIDTIRYYEKSGVCPPIARAPDGQRRFTPENLDWFVLLASLRNTGKPTARMKAFANLYRHGDATIADRKEMLEAHGAHLDQQQQHLDQCRALLGRKIERYEQIMEAWHEDSYRWRLW
ncbi:MerR family transcriptional regulator [uncultured Tateyamaria sp.]|uniref:MerR family transcriptional regulator n=1 Tax=uncultured Tateyamaria sp. TaxID=455651 RepID=UPI00261967A2|nr:MerR family transcriptional regulator [uncultured Tateyamaria sp.]